MTHKEIIDIEQENTGYINLHLEGTFYKAYEQSALLRNPREGFLKHFDGGEKEII